MSVPDVANSISGAIFMVRGLRYPIATLSTSNHFKSKDQVDYSRYRSVRGMVGFRYCSGHNFSLSCAQLEHMELLRMLDLQRAEPCRDSLVLLHRSSVFP